MAIGIGGVLGAILAIIAGILIIIFPGLLRWTVGIYLILIGILALIPF